MKHLASGEFWNGYYKLPPEIRALADKNYSFLLSNPAHPSLHFKKSKRGKYWSVRIGLSHRALATEIDGGYLWGWIGTHAEYNRIIESL